MQPIRAYLCPQTYLYDLKKVADKIHTFHWNCPSVVFLNMALYFPKNEILVAEHIGFSICTGLSRAATRAAGRINSKFISAIAIQLIQHSNCCSTYITIHHNWTISSKSAWNIFSCTTSSDYGWMYGSILLLSDCQHLQNPNLCYDPGNLCVKRLVFCDDDYREKCRGGHFRNDADLVILEQKAKGEKQVLIFLQRRTGHCRCLTNMLTHLEDRFSNQKGKKETPHL